MRKRWRRAFYKGYIQGLEDPYSVYTTKRQTKDLYETTEGEYSGIGAVLSQDLESGVNHSGSRFMRILRLRRQGIKGQ